MALAVFVKFQLAVESAAVSVKPNPNGGPGTPALEKLVNGLAADRAARLRRRPADRRRAVGARQQIQQLQPRL